MADRNPIPRLTTRSSEGIRTMVGPPDNVVTDAAPSDKNTSPRIMEYSKDGSLCAWGTPEGVTVADALSGEVVCRLERKRVVELVFSPASSFLATWENYQVKKGEDASKQQHDNLFIYDARTGELITSWVCKRHEDWQPQWTSDDSVCVKGVSNEVQFYNARDFKAGCTNRAKFQQLGKFALAPGTGPLKLAAFVPGQKGAPSAVRLYVGSFAQPVCNKSFYKADKVNIEWNSQGTSVLVSTQTEVDKTGQSYYGETNLYYLGSEGLSSQVHLDKRGPIYDFTWSPNGKEFAVVYGFMPAKAMVFNHKCDQVFDFGTGPRSMVKYSPNGNILCIAGYGNLRGDTQFWDRQKLKLINQFQASDSTYFAWCPDSRHILTATCSPRLKVDNGFKIWHYAKGLVHKQDYKELFAVRWRPTPTKSYDVRPISPVPKEVAQAAAAPKQVYRPPGARGKKSTIKLHEEEKPKEKEMSKAALKNKRKREAAKARKLAEQEKAAAAPAEVAAKPAPQAAATSGASEAEKKLRNLNKKLRQIESLKAKQAAGETLQDNQVEKIGTEAAVREEIAQWEKQLQ